jgi:hypothetical protein
MSMPPRDEEMTVSPSEREMSMPRHGREMSMPLGDRELPMPPPGKEMNVDPSEREISMPPDDRKMSVSRADVGTLVPFAGEEIFLPSTDVEMTVAASQAPETDIATTVPLERPKVPPIPDSTGPLKQPKRGERRKSAVQGAKVDKRSVTGTTQPKPKSRNLTRKPTASVGKLVEQAKKINKAADGFATDDEMDGNKPKVAGKVAAAVDKIEKQVKQQEERKNLKQKNGSPVRRSQRVKQAVRTSMP